uniref:Outer dynein arm-docking complex subunit 4 n=1 Tax=Timema poppense TaxID=170557 RepID=A0A7R9DHF2_TIMPO|nr:unnamed protein product [Timema poppensis]
MFRRKVAVKEQQMFGFGEEEIKPEPYHPFTEEAQVLLKKRQYNTALKYLDISLDLTPDNPLTLANKSGCLINMFEPEEAMPSAARSLVEYKRYVEEELDGRQETVYALGLLKKSESLYHQTEFEQALVFFHRGAKLRPNMELFHKGIKKAKKAILNAIGKR